MSVDGSRGAPAQASQAPIDQEADDTTTDEVLRAARLLVPGLEMTTAVPLGEGLDHKTLLIDGHLVARMAKKDEDLRLEARQLEFVGSLSPLPVPRPAAVQEYLLLHPLLTGIPLLKLAAPHGRLVGNAAASLGALLAALWSTPSEQTGDMFNVDHQPLAVWREEAATSIERLGDYIPLGLSPGLARWLDEPLPAEADALVLSHNDLGAEHILIDAQNDRVSGVIDWSDAAFIDPAKDLGVLLRDLGQQDSPRSSIVSSPSSSSHQR